MFVSTQPPLRMTPVTRSTPWCMSSPCTILGHPCTAHSKFYCPTRNAYAKSAMSFPPSLIREPDKVASQTKGGSDTMRGVGGLCPCVDLHIRLPRGGHKLHAHPSPPRRVELPGEGLLQHRQSGYRPGTQ